MISFLFLNLICLTMILLYRWIKVSSWLEVVLFRLRLCISIIFHPFHMILNSVFYIYFKFSSRGILTFYSLGYFYYLNLWCYVLFYPFPLILPLIFHIFLHVFFLFFFFSCLFFFIFYTFSFFSFFFTRTKLGSNSCPSLLIFYWK